MYKKICVILFVTLSCYSVTNSSPAKENVTELLANERQAASTEVNSQINHKIEATAPGGGTDNIVAPNVKPSSNHSEPDAKDIHNNSTSQNTSTIHYNITQVPLNSSNLTPKTIKPIPPKTSTPVSTTKGITVTDLPPSNYSDMSRPIIPGQSTTVVTPAPGTTTTAAPGTAPPTKPTAATQTPTAAPSTSTDNVLLEHTTSAKAQESRFDGASFVGGIVLTIGLTAIGFIAFKYYKSGKIDGNYRTL